MDIELVSKVILITIYSLFSIIRIEFYRRTRKAGYKTVIEERKKYSIWLSIFICYTVFTFFIYILFPQALVWAKVSLTFWLRLLGALMAVVALLWFIWIHRSLGNNLSLKISIKEEQELVTGGPYRWVRHPMYSAFYLLHLAVFFLTANWFIGVTWLVGLTVIILLRVKREEAMLLAKFGNKYSAYMERTGRFVPIVRRR
ncbi:MAG: isoprenylcysteine carboxylmethyltransferase family protein [Dehalococcoidales bacterium]|nr:isoprenylcysteine carboxylmethyltransferase family protein [Dehalococcoidales bacterium]